MIKLKKIFKKIQYNNMNCNYDCDESPLSSNDCLVKDVTRGGSRGVGWGAPP